MSLSTPAPSRARLRRLSAGAAALTVSGLLVLSGCGSDSSTSAAANPGGQSSQGGQRGGGAGGNRIFGLIADVSGKTVQVQASDAQTAVTWTSKTTFTTQVSQSLGAVKVGSCVVAQSAAAAASGSTTITASTIAVSAAAKGACAGGFGGMGQGGAGRPSGAPSGMPSGGPQGMPSGGPQGMPSGAPSGAAQRSRPVSGKVTAVSGSSYTVEVADGSDTTQSYTVDTTDKTTVTAEKSTTAKALKVGACATVSGKADSTGAVTATAIGLRPATNGTCSFGMGGRGNG